MDRLERRIIQLKIEREALKKEKDEASKKRLQTLESQLDELGTRIRRPRGDLEGREGHGAGRGADQGGARARASWSSRRRAARSDLTRMSELQYGKIPGAREAARGGAGGGDRRRTTLLRNKVTDEEIAEVVSKWTGIPVSKMLEGEREKLLRMEEALGQRVVGQDEAVTRRLQRDPPLARRARPIRIGRTARSCSSARPASARPSSARRSPSSCSTPTRRWCASTCPSSWRSTPWRG